jgi:GntR family transcriptional regulator, arabinose operon transcriptional repressor
MANVDAQGGRVFTPKYLQVKEHLLGRLRAGEISAESPLPSERELAASLEVAVGTLRNALRELESEGLIRRIQGKGTFVNSPLETRSRKRTDVFALIIPQVQEAFYPSLIHGFEEAATEVQHQLIVSNSHNDRSRQEDLIRQAIDKDIAGIALVPTTYPLTPPEQIDLMRNSLTPLVFCHRRVEGVRAPLVTWSGRRVGQLIGEAFLEQGHRRITSVVAYQDVMFDSVSEGIRETLRGHGLSESAYQARYYRERLPGKFAERAIHDTLAALLQQEDRPTALCCHNLPDAEQVYVQAGQFGLRIPEDLSLVYFGGAWRPGPLAQHISCVGIDEAKLGLEAGRLLAAISAGRVPHDADDKVEIPVEFLPGGTIRSPS